MFGASHRRWVNKRILSKFIGTAIALSPAIPAGRFHLLQLYDSLNSSQSWRSDVMVRLSNGAFRQLKYFWSQLLPSHCIVSWDPSDPDELLFTDSSDFGLGAHLSQVNSMSDVVSGLWPSSDSTQHITFKELKVI